MLNEKKYFVIYISFFIALCMRYIVSAEPKYFFNYENRTEKVFRLAQPQSLQTETECIVFY